MLATVSSAILTGVEGRPISVEVHVSTGIPSFTVVGLPDDPATLDLSLLAFKEITIRGSLVYDEQDFASALAHLAAASKKIQVRARSARARTKLCRVTAG